MHAYLVELAGALATLPDDEIESATGVDVTYRARAELHNVVDFAEWVEDEWEANPSWQAAERFEAFLPEASRMFVGRKCFTCMRRTWGGRCMAGEGSGEIDGVNDQELAAVAGLMPEVAQCSGGASRSLRAGGAYISRDSCPDRVAK